MQYLLTQEELDALKSKDKTPRGQALKEVMALFTEEFSNMKVHTSYSMEREAMFTFRDVKAWLDRVQDRVQKLHEEQCKT
jgi:hypothetical protein